MRPAITHRRSGFTAAETKAGRSYHATLPPELSPYIDRYLRVHRPALQSIAQAGGEDETTGRLWIGRLGTPISGKGIRRQIEERTEQAFGKAIWPHLFRDCAVTELVDSAPSPRQIARRLNAGGVPGPRGGEWLDTTIRGQCGRGTGILNNEIYVGRNDWNQCSYVKNPATGKRVARRNAEEDWEVVPIPELRIVSDELWDAVKARQAEVRTTMRRDEHGNALNGRTGMCASRDRSGRS